MKYGIIGAGAMGYRYGIMLQENAGCKVDFIETWEPALTQVRHQGGVLVARDHQNQHLVSINIYSPEEYQGHPDVWIIFKKQMQLEEELARDAAAGLFTPDQIAFSAMNGMGHFEKINQYFSADRILCGTAMIATRLNGPANVDFMGATGTEVMHMARYDRAVPDERDQAVLHDFAAAQLGPVWAEDWQGMCLSKVVFNAVCNTLCTMFELQMGQFIAYEGVREMARQLFDEAYDTCERAGIYLLESRQAMTESVITVSKAYQYHYPSMYQDLAANRPTEVDYINGYIARLARDHGFVCPTHEFVTHQVHLAETARQFKSA